MGQKLDLTGRVYGLLTVLRENGHLGVKVAWLCKCRCGKEITVRGNDLKRGRTVSCGCVSPNKKHGLYSANKHLYFSIFTHFRRIRLGERGYKGWTLDCRYADNTDGVAKFCQDLIRLQPEMCKQYEIDKSLDLDKDNGGNVFCPECIVFRHFSENRSNTRNKILLEDGTRFVDFCKNVGVAPIAHRKVTKPYLKYSNYYRYHKGKGHPELVKKANDLILLYRQCLALLQLKDEVEKLRQRL